MSNEVALRPTYWASVSGGKDSLYMLNLILHNLDKYQLDGVVHFELEIDYPFIKDVIDYMESECKKHGITFMRIKPRKSWEEMYYHTFSTGTQRLFPTRKARWCSNKYKRDCNLQLKDWLKTCGCYPVFYIGFCADEEKRFKKKEVEKGLQRYPLAEFGIYEQTILEWARTEPIFNHYYEANTRCGCMYCPLSNKLEFAYLYKYYPENWKYMIEKMKETEAIREKELGRPFSCTSSDPKYNAEYLEYIIPTKWLPILSEKEKAFRDYTQLTLKDIGAYDDEI